MNVSERKPLSRGSSVGPTRLCPECEMRQIPLDAGMCEECDQWWMEQEERERVLEESEPTDA